MPGTRDKPLSSHQETFRPSCVYFPAAAREAPAVAAHREMANDDK